MALLEWFRAAELSCDRAAALVTRDPQAVCRALMVLSAGEAAADLDLDAFVAQATDYDEAGAGFDRLTRLMQDMRLTHPMPVRRVRRLLDWVREGDYDRIVGGEYPAPRRGAAAARRGRRGAGVLRASACPTRSPRRGPRSRRSASSSATGWPASAVPRKKPHARVAHAPWPSTSTGGSRCSTSIPSWART